MEFPAEACGPKMMALADDRRRKFAFLIGCGEEDASQAARDAGYADPGSHSASVRVQAHRLLQDPGIIDAISEIGRNVLHGLVPLAIKRARKVLDDPKHPAHARMIETVLDRTGFFAKSEHKVVVEHTADLKQLEDFARRLAAENGISADRLLGVNASNREAKIIESTAEEDKA